MNLSSLSTLVHVLRERSLSQPDQLAISYMLDDDREVSLTYAGLDREARAIAARLGEEEIALGARILLLFPPGPSFVAAFFGCLYAGMVAVPVYPPDPVRLTRSLPKLLAIVADARPSAVLTTSTVALMANAISGVEQRLGSLPWLATDTISPSLAERWQMPGVRGEDIALLQYTSGSTSFPKGVVVSHANLIRNSADLCEAFANQATSRCVSWLPTYHDMGLIGGLLQPIYGGFQVTLLSPIDFLQRPVRWLRAISKARATVSGGPNFAYELCVRKVTSEERRGLDLSSWKVAFTGAEPIRAATLDAFARAFAEAGFRREAFYPCYGLAEATLIVTGATPGEGASVRSVSAAGLARGDLATPAGDEDVRQLVACGRVVGDQRVAIVDPVTLEPAPVDRIGEIWVQGANVASAYWNNAHATAQTFGARLKDGQGPFLRTGDLGFLDDAQRLFVAGRSKDLLIIRGRNIYPQDLEHAIERSSSHVRPGCSAAFGIERGDEETIAVVAEVVQAALADPTVLAAVADEVRGALSREHEVAVSEVLLLLPGTIPKTSSGKIQRHACREAFLAGTLAIAFRGHVVPQNRITVDARSDTAGGDPLQVLHHELARLLRVSVDAVDLDRPLASLGIDSLMAVELADAVELRLGTRLGLSEVLAAASVRSLAAGIEGRGPGRGAVEPIKSAPRGSEAPLSFAQERLWLLAQLDPSSVANNVAVRASLEGSVDVAAFEWCVNELLRRHDVLRARFDAEGRMQSVAQGPQCSIVSWVDLTGCPAEARIAAEDARIFEDSRVMFDLAAGGLVRVTVLRTSAERASLLLVAHHIVADGQSAFRLLRELAEAYGARLQRSAPPVDSPRQYADFAREEREALSTSVLEPSLAFWKNELEGAPPLIDVPTDGPRSLRASHSGARRRKMISPARMGQLRAVARDASTTPFVVIVAGVAAMLHRWTQQNDIVLGTVVSTRTLIALREVCGDFTNFLPLRVRISPADTALSLISRVRETTLAAFGHSHCPFEKIVEAVRPVRSASQNQIYNVAVIEHGYAAASSLRFGASAIVDAAVVDNGTAELDLSFEMFPTEDGGLALDCRYSSDIFAADTAERMLSHLERTLDFFADRRSGALTAFPVMTAEERHTLVDVWNETAVAYDLDRCVHQLFEAQVDRTPDAIAVTCGNSFLSYRQLDVRANRLARHLRARGVTRGTLVGVCLERSLDLVVTLVATLKAGGAYVPLEVDLPAGRREFIRSDAGVTTVVTTRELAVAGTEGTAILLDEHQDIISRELASRPASNVESTDLAYVIYTSGSTGKPKGAMNAHRAVVNRLLWMRDAEGFDVSDVVLQKTPFGFDVSVWEFFCPLSCGARLVLARPGGHRETSYLIDVVNEECVSTIHFVPSMLHAMLEDERFATCKSLSRVVCSGEALPYELKERYFDALSAPLYNLYGPTEAAVDVTSWRCEKGEPAKQTVPIGYPVANVSIYVLDERLRLVPLGARGELFIGGVAVGRGYHRRPDLTAERFVPDPFSAEPGSTLYRTGDEVRFRADGSIEFLGRLDDQIKLRGYRIELGEVRSILLAHPGVREAVVVVRRGTSGDRLCAYVVPHGERITADSLDAWCRTSLPEYMVPTWFSFLEAFPLTPSGKLDRGALASPPVDRHLETSAPPRDPYGEIAASIAAELLGVPSFGVDDDFFLAGGHSLLATQFLSRLRKALGVDIPLAAFFEEPTVAGVTRRAREGGLAMSAAPAPGRMPRGADVPLSFAQERLWFLTQLYPQLTAYNVPRALRFRGALDIAALERAFSELLRRHEILRATFTLVGDRAVQRFLPFLEVIIPVTDLTDFEQEDRERRAEAIVVDEGRRLFDLEHGPMVRLRIVRMSSDDHLLVLTEHHLVHDGWTQGVLARDFLSLYESCARGEKSSLPDLPLQYADYVLWQRDWLRGPERERLVAYWRARLSGVPPLDLPTDRPRSAVSTFRGAEHRFEIPPLLAQELRALSRREGATLFMTLLATFDVLLARYSGQLDIVVGIAVANRRWEELEGLVGMFINTLVHRCDLSGDVTFRELLARVRRTSLADYAHQDLPFEQLVEALQPTRSLSHMPFAQVWFGFQDVPEPPLRLPGLDIEVVYRHNGSAKNDLALMLVPHAEQRVGTADQGSDLGIVGLLEYNSDIYEPETVARMAAHFLQLLQGIVNHPACDVRDLPLTSEANEQRILCELNQTSIPYRRDARVEDLFYERAVERGEALAIRDSSVALSYRDLAARGEAVARELKKLDVNAGARVAICVERGAPLPVAILGALRAGAAYVPIDPEWPSERTAYVMSDAGVSAVVTTGDLAERVPPCGAARIMLSADGVVCGTQSGAPRSPTGVTRAAYVLYTSGSTGRPKGVQVEHDGLLNLVAWHHRTYDVTSRDRATLAAGPAFDASSWELWAYLCAGASLHVPSAETRADSASLVAWMVSEQITLSFLPTALAEMVLLERWPAETSLRALLTGGDVLRRRPRKGLPFRVFNHYGPTEATVVTTSSLVHPEGDDCSLPRIGHPIDNTRVYLLDGRDRMVPLGVRAELCISGVGLASNYVGDADLTEQRFVPNPYEPGALMYRTGDFARLRNDGEIEFAGRRDWQVKLRGQRIELGEIESVVSAHEGVRACAIVLQGEGSTARLIAYVVLRTTAAPTTAELRAFLVDRLPEAMVPAAFVPLEHLPLTTSGKVDRRALPACDDGPSEKFVAPRTTSEEAVAAIWSEVLGVPQVGVNDDFFVLGGHSLSATRILARLRTNLGVEVPLRSLFQTPTVAQLAAMVDAIRAARGRPAARVVSSGEPREEGEL